MIAWQHRLTLAAKPRGFHLVTEELLAALPDLKPHPQGLLHLLLLHTSASLTLNENADPTVRADFSRFFHHLVPEHLPLWTHTCEGPDDATAHIKSSLLGTSLLLPVHRGTLALGTWQGIYLGEHREHGGRRSLMATLMT
jgi:secondary thiamine-phosphate synthase enzyme